MDSTRNCFVTKRISVVDTLDKSILPTGALKIEDGSVFQEAMVINHKATVSNPAVISYEWLPISNDFIEALQRSPH